MRYYPFTSCFCLAFVLLGSPQCAHVADEESKSWQSELAHELQVLGSRNWIVVAEPSFASLSGQGAKTIVTDEASTEVLKRVLNILESYSYTNPSIYLPLEMSYVGEDYAPGMKSFRKEVKNILLGQNTQEASHETLRRLVLDAAKNYNVLIVKTTTTLPFSNIYMELDSGYWSSESESALRRKMEGGKKTPAPEKGASEQQSDKPEQQQPASSSDKEKSQPLPSSGLFDSSNSILI